MSISPFDNKSLNVFMRTTHNNYGTLNNPTNILNANVGEMDFHAKNTEMIVLKLGT